MKRGLIACALALAAFTMAACSGVSAVTGGGAVLESTVLDEKAMFTVEAAYYAANTAADAAVDAGLLQPGSAEAVKVADALATARGAVILARMAYDAGDARSYAVRVEAARVLVAQLAGLVPEPGA